MFSIWRRWDRAAAARSGRPVRSTRPRTVYRRWPPGTTCNRCARRTRRRNGNIRGRAGRWRVQGPTIWQHNNPAVQRNDGRSRWVCVRVLCVCVRARSENGRFYLFSDSGRSGVTVAPVGPHSQNSSSALHLDSELGLAWRSTCDRHTVISQVGANSLSTLSMTSHSVSSSLSSCERALR